MKPFVQRTVSELEPTGPVLECQCVSPDDYSDTPAWVLLGDPGSGKTRQFKHEVERCVARGESAVYITARDFATFGSSRQDWIGSTLFIDALDEVRAGMHNSEWYFDLIRRNLNELGKPKFRIASRYADWYGKIDRDHLTQVSNDSSVVVLQLDRLNDSQIRCLLDSYQSVVDDEDFLTRARHHRVDGLLENPQSLDMLVRLVAAGSEWPHSRFELFSSACEHMATESNPQHGLPHYHHPNTASILDIAGRVCAVQLITDSPEVMTNSSEPTGTVLTIRDFQSTLPKDIMHTLSTNLFISSMEGRRTPAHRNIAEFVAARYLARRIATGLPVQRVLALITGHDGMIVTTFRGLSAWLATHCKDARPAIIKRDPIAVASYGDLTRFDLNHKKLILNSLFQQITEQVNRKLLAPVCAQLISPGTIPLLIEKLRLVESSEKHLRIVLFILDMLCVRRAMHSFTAVLLEMVNDYRWPYVVKTAALEALVHNHDKRSGDIAMFLDLLEKTQSHVLGDPDGELTGILLSYLYPDHLAAESVLDYLHDGVTNRFGGSFIGFWNRGLLVHTDSKRAAIILNNLAREFQRKRTIIRMYSLYELPSQLLLLAVKDETASVDIHELYEWLRLTSTIADSHPTRATDEIGRIRHWLSARPKIAMELIDMAFEMQLQYDNAVRFSTDVDGILLGSTPPPEFGRWCLDKALEVVASRPVLATHLLARCSEEFEIRKRRYRLTPELIQSAAETIGFAKRVETHNEQHVDVHMELPSSGDTGRTHWLQRLQSDRTLLSDEAFNAQNLHIVGRAYFGLTYEIDEAKGIAGIRKLFETDMNLVKCALDSISHVIGRNDLPLSREIISLFARQRRHILGLPFLACVDQSVRVESIDKETWNAEQVSRAVAFYYAEPYLPHPSSEFRSLINSDATATIDTLAQMTLVDVRYLRRTPWKSLHLVDLLADERDAQYASLKIIARYPPDCSVSQIDVLDRHIWRMLASDNQVMGAVAEDKLSRKTLCLGQHIRWLMVKTLLQPSKSLSAVEEFVAGNQRRVGHLATFLRTVSSNDYREFFGRIRVIDEISQVQIVEMLVRVLGRYSTPSDQFRSGWIDSIVDMSRFVFLLIEFLSTRGHTCASSAFDSLCGDRSLVNWRSLLLSYRGIQSALSRDAQFSHPTVSQVNQVLEGGGPANSADLFALVLDCLERIAQSYRVDDGNLWRKFWNEDSHGKVVKPKSENSCRDGLAGDLRGHLPSGVDVVSEARFIYGNRADLLVMHGDIAVALEIKKHSNAYVWTGLQDQLVDKYGKHQSTSGYGIYVVLWFGECDASRLDDGHDCTASDSIRVEVLRRAGLSDSVRERISVVVLDLSVPSNLSGV